MSNFIFNIRLSISLIHKTYIHLYRIRIPNTLYYDYKNIVKFVLIINVSKKMNNTYLYTVIVS